MPDRSTIRVLPELSNTVAENSNGDLVFTFDRTLWGFPYTFDYLTVMFALTGSADAGVDYTTSPSFNPGIGLNSDWGFVTFYPGFSTATLTITPISDNLIEGNETVAVQIMPSSAYNIGVPQLASGTITDSSESNDNGSNGRSVPINGTLGNDILTGTSENNLINGQSGNDSLSGLGGNDSLIGGNGSDTLTGGRGADRFIFSGANAGGALRTSTFRSRDRITDFNFFEGDRFELGFDNNVVTPDLPRRLFNAGRVRARNLRQAIEAVYDDPNGRRQGDRDLGRNEATLFQFRQQTFLVVNDRNPNYSVRNDLIIDVTGIQYGPGDRRPGNLVVTEYFG